MDFDPQSFLDATTTEQSIKRPPLPPGDYTAVTGEVKARQWSSKKEDAKVKEGIAFDVPLAVEVPLSVQEQLKLGPVVNMQDSIMVQLTELGAIDYGVGKNAGLRKYREATGMNEPGQPFNPRMLGGKVIKVKIGSRIYEGELYDEVQGVSKA